MSTQVIFNDTRKGDCQIHSVTLTASSVKTNTPKKRAVSSVSRKWYPSFYKYFYLKPK